MLSSVPLPLPWPRSRVDSASLLWLFSTSASSAVAAVEGTAGTGRWGGGAVGRRGWVGGREQHSGKLAEARGREGGRGKGAADLAARARKGRPGLRNGRGNTN